MGLFGTVIIGHDGTATGDAAAGLGSAIARLSGDAAEIVLARADRHDAPRARGDEAERARRNEALKRLESAGRRLQDVRLRPHRAQAAGSPEQVLRDAAREAGAGLIVVAAPPGERGGTAERLVREAPAAIAVARPWTGAHPRLSRVSVAVDGAEPAGPVLAYATALAGVPDTPVEELEVLSYGDGPAPAWLARAAAAHGARLVREAADPAEALLERSRCVDLLLVGTREPRALRRLASAGVSAGVVRSAECPVMLVPRGVRAPAGTA